MKHVPGTQLYMNITVCYQEIIPKLIEIDI